MVTAVETHYHTIASGHAYSTVLEGVMYAKRYGMKGLAVTDHGPAMPGAPHIWHFGNQSAIGERRPTSWTMTAGWTSRRSF